MSRVELRDRGTIYAVILRRVPPSSPPSGADAERRRGAARPAGRPTTSRRRPLAPRRLRALPLARRAHPVGAHDARGGPARGRLRRAAAAAAGRRRPSGRPRAAATPRWSTRSRRTTPTARAAMRTRARERCAAKGWPTCTRRCDDRPTTCTTREPKGTSMTVQTAQLASCVEAIERYFHRILDRARD